MNDSNNTVTMRSSILKDLYEKHRQSPYYDNLCRPISDLIPFIDSGIRGVTTNPAVFSSFFLYLYLLSLQNNIVIFIGLYFTTDI